MNVEIGAEAAQFLLWESISSNSLQCGTGFQIYYFLHFVAFADTQLCFMQKDGCDYQVIQLKLTEGTVA